MAEVQRLRDLQGRLLQERFGDQVVLAASTGPARDVGSVDLSPVLRAMSVASEVGMGAIWPSLGCTTTETEVAEQFPAMADSVRAAPASAPARARERHATCAEQLPLLVGGTTTRDRC